MPRRADDLAMTEQVIHRGQRTTILGPAVPWVDRFGRPMVKLWARREDTGAVGFIHYGADALADMAEMIDEDGSHNVACECGQCQEEEASTGRYVVTFDTRRIDGPGAVRHLRRMSLTEARELVAFASPTHTGRIINVATLQVID